MTKSAVYTRSGDKGETSLVSGERVSKGELRIHLYGEVDELNSFIGLAVSKLDQKYIEQIHFLEDIQSRLFDLGSNLACMPEKRDQYKLPQISDEEIKKIEVSIDQMDGEVEKLKNFILPGGHEISSLFHICRSIARRVERTHIHFYKKNSNEVMPMNSEQYLNRLSDYFFVLARYINKCESVSEKIWKSK